MRRAGTSDCCEETSNHENVHICSVNLRLRVRHSLRTRASRARSSARTAGLGRAPKARADEWDRMIDVTLRVLLHTPRAFADDLLAAGARGGPADLVHAGSVGGHARFPDWSVHCATQAAVTHLTTGRAGRGTGAEGMIRAPGIGRVSGVGPRERESPALWTCLC
ncbi:SDR family NAD(P)-dependent oxidoreductase [Streptomyces sp. URMC 128]|uniref:SDR family NAD(P)-dependent oxidoreductase n=1 Tax=Streptomyces sp. URMC 128 TaxID=3423404 RepID=UPI003F1B6BD0